MRTATQPAAPAPQGGDTPGRNNSNPPRPLLHGASTSSPPQKGEEARGYLAALCAATLLGSLRKAPRGPSAYFRLAAGMAVVALGTQGHGRLWDPRQEDRGRCQARGAQGT